jgi:predicted nucleic acid-binding protein
MSFIVDASVAVRWYFPEQGSEEAERVLVSQADLIAPELIIAEIGSAALKRVRKRELSAEEAVHIVAQALTAFTALIALRGLASEAMRYAAELDHPIYDCFYLALAASEGTPIVTADRKLAVLAERVGVSVELLALGTQQAG